MKRKDNQARSDKGVARKYKSKKGGSTIFFVETASGGYYEHINPKTKNEIKSM